MNLKKARSLQKNDPKRFEEIAQGKKGEEAVNDCNNKKQNSRHKNNKTTKIPPLDNTNVKCGDLIYSVEHQVSPTRMDVSICSHEVLSVNNKTYTTIPNRRISKEKVLTLDEAKRACMTLIQEWQSAIKKHDPSNDAPIAKGPEV